MTYRVNFCEKCLQKELYKTYLERQPGEEIVLAGKMTNNLVFQIIFGLVSEFEFWEEV